MEKLVQQIMLEKEKFLNEKIFNFFFYFFFNLNAHSSSNQKIINHFRKY